MATSPFIRWFLLAAALVLFGLSFDLGGYPLLDPDEGRNAEVAREMAVTNDYVLPRLNGLPYLDKPVLYFAAAALSMELFGPNIVAARLTSLVFTVCTLILICWFGSRRFGREAGLVAAVATATAPLTLAYARTVIFDSALTFFVVLALVAFYESIERATPRPTGATGDDSAKRLSWEGTGGVTDGPVFPLSSNGLRGSGEWWRLLAWGALAFGVLTKGPVALALPLMVVVPYAAVRRAWRGLADLVSVLLFIALLGPWLLAVSREIPEFLEYALVTETALRIATDELHRTEPFWYFFAILPAAALPWSVVVLGGWRELKSLGRGKLRGSQLLFLILWIVVPLAFFTLSQSKRPQYVLPLVPAIALLVGVLWTARPDRLPGVRAAAMFLGVLGITLLLGRGRISDIVAATPLIAATIPGTAIGLGIACLVATVGTWFGAKRAGLALASLCVPMAAIPLVSRSLMDEVGRERSARDLAVAIEQVITPETEVVGIHAFPLSLPFYLRRTLTLATSDGHELTSNYLARHLNRWRRVRGTTLRPPTWWRDALRLCQRPRVFVVQSEDAASRALLETALPPLIDTGRYAGYGPCGPASLAGRTGLDLQAGLARQPPAIQLKRPTVNRGCPAGSVGGGACEGSGRRGR